MAVLAVVLVLAAGCGVDTGGNPSEQTENRTGGSASGTTVVSGPDEGYEASGPEDGDSDDFAASAETSGGEEGAADRIEGVRFRIFDGYERLLVDFGREGGAAGVPLWSVESPREGGYVRVRFPGLTSTRVADKDFVGSVLDELYVVHDRESGLFVDVFAMQAFRYRVTERTESGELAVDLRGVREEINLPPTKGDRVVVLQPREAEEVSGPLIVRGYARSFEGQLAISLLDRRREVISSKTVRADDRTTAWRPFEARLEFSGYEGLATLRVGGRGPRAGSFVGTETEVIVE